MENAEIVIKPLTESEQLFRLMIQENLKSIESDDFEHHQDLLEIINLAVMEAIEHNDDYSSLSHHVDKFISYAEEEDNIKYQKFDLELMYEKARQLFIEKSGREN